MKAYAINRPTVRAGRLDRVATATSALPASNNGLTISKHSERAVAQGTDARRRGAIMAGPRGPRGSRHRPAPPAGRFGRCRGSADSTRWPRDAAAGRLEAHARSPLSALVPEGCGRGGDVKLRRLRTRPATSTAARPVPPPNV